MLGYLAEHYYWPLLISVVIPWVSAQHYCLYSLQPLILPSYCLSSAFLSLPHRSCPHISWNCSFRKRIVWHCACDCLIRGSGLVDFDFSLWPPARLSRLFQEPKSGGMKKLLWFSVSVWMIIRDFESWASIILVTITCCARVKNFDLLPFWTILVSSQKSLIKYLCTVAVWGQMDTDCELRGSEQS